MKLTIVFVCCIALALSSNSLAQSTRCFDYNDDNVTIDGTDKIYTYDNGYHVNGQHDANNVNSIIQGCHYKQGQYDPTTGWYKCIGWGTPTSIDLVSYEQGQLNNSGYIHCVGVASTYFSLSAQYPTQGGGNYWGAGAAVQSSSSSCGSSNTPTVSIDGPTGNVTSSNPGGVGTLFWTTPSPAPHSTLENCPAEEALTTPLVVSWGNDQFVNSFTGPNDGYKFAYTSIGDLRPVTWTKKDADVGWLVLPDASGHITDLKHSFFTNFTHQKAKMINGVYTTNAMEALAYYDLPENGGNGDGLIDSGDAVWSVLRVWKSGSSTDYTADRNDPKKVFTLDQILGHSGTIDVLNYIPGTKVDGHKNKQLWIAPVTTDNGTVVHVYDVEFGG